MGSLFREWWTRDQQQASRNVLVSGCWRNLSKASETEMLLHRMRWMRLPRFALISSALMRCGAWHSTTLRIAMRLQAA
jgi:hypothetical protein